MPSNRTAIDLKSVIAPSGTATIGRSDGGAWRFLVKSDQMILVSIHQDGGLSDYPPKQQYIAPNSAQEFQGKGSVILTAQNLSTGASAQVSTYNLEYLCGGLEPYIFAEDYQGSTLATWVDAGSNGGYPQPYTNMFRVYCDEPIRVQAIDRDGTVVFQSGQQPVDEVILQSFVAPSNLKFQVRQSVSSGTNTWFQVTWFRKEGW